MPVTALRYHNVYGPRMPRDTPYAGVASIFRSALEAGREPRVFEDGGQRRDFVHVRDVAHANVLALTAAEPVPGAFNVCSGTPRTVGDLAAELARAAGGPAPVTDREFRLGDVRHVFACAERARDVLGFEARDPLRRGRRGVRDRRSCAEAQPPRGFGIPLVSTTSKSLPRSRLRLRRSSLFQPRARRARDVDARPVVGEQHPVALERADDHARLAREVVRVRRRS